MIRYLCAPRHPDHDLRSIRVMAGPDIDNLSFAGSIRLREPYFYDFINDLPAERVVLAFREIEEILANAAD